MLVIVTKVMLVMLVAGAVYSYPQLFETKSFKVGIEYDHSLPMTGGSDRYRHRNNYDPFFVTVTASAKDGYVISYLEVSATVDIAGKVDFCLLRGDTGSKNMVFQLISNYSDFLSYSYLTYGIREEEYKKIANIVTVPLPSSAHQITSYCTFIIFIALYLLFLTS